MSHLPDTTGTQPPFIAATRPRVALVAAMTTENVIGVANRLPWTLSADLKRFRALTLHHCVVMGRRTYESIGVPLPNRTNIVVSRGGFVASECISASSLLDALRRCPVNEATFVIGGGELYLQAMPYASRIYLTLIEAHEKKLPLFTPFEGDAYFPQIDPGEWAISRLGRRNVARPKGRAAPVAFRSVYFRFIDFVRIKQPSARSDDTEHQKFDL